jgi:hypothetical protein
MRPAALDPLGQQRPLAIAAAKRPGPRPLIAGPESSVRSRNRRAPPLEPALDEERDREHAADDEEGRARRARRCAARA